MLNIGNKVFRNMQEQVGYLNALVEELKVIIRDKEYSIKEVKIEDGHLIFELNDGEIIDAGTILSISSVEIDASSHLVINYTDGTSDDVGLIKSILSVTKNASGHVIVSYSDGTSADLGLLKGISSCSLDANKHLIINYDNGTTEDVGAVLSGEYDLSGLDVIAKTFSQSQPNYTATFNISTTTGLTVNNIYNRVEVINNVLYLIYNIEFTNSTGSSITIGTASHFSSVEISLSTAIASQILDLNNKTVAEADDKVLITLFESYSASSLNPGATIKNLLCHLRNSGALNKMYVYIFARESITIADGAKNYVTGRCELTLL